MPKLQPTRFHFSRGFWPNSTIFGEEAAGTMSAGNNVWLRATGRIDVANGSAQTAAQNVGARIFQFNTQRATIEGALISSRIPYAGFLRFQNAAALYLSELTSKQVYLDEVAATNLTTSATAGQLRVGVYSGSWNAYDAGFEKVVLASGDVTTDGSGTKSMTGTTGIAIAPWRTATNAIGGPSNIIYSALDGGAASRVILTLTTLLSTAPSGQDGWILAGTRWGDASGDLRVIRYVRNTARGTFTCTNGVKTVTAGSGTYFFQDLRSGDTITIGAVDYVVDVVTSQTTMTLTANFGETTGAGKTAVMKKICGDWRNGELGDLLDYDTFKPVPAAGVFQFGGRAFIWGCYGATGTTTGPAIIPLLTNNPEHIGLTTILTGNGDDLLNVLPGETRLFLMTQNTLEAVYFTGETDNPYRVRILHQPGFAAAMNGVVYKDRFWGYSVKPIRTQVDDNIDDDFAVPVWSAMKSWTPANVVITTDPKNEAVLFCHYDGASTTTCIPYMTALGVWGPSHTVSGQIVDSAVVNGTLYFTLLTGGNYRVYTWEGGSAGAASSPYIASQFYALGDESTRKVMKSFVVSGNVATVYAYRITEAGTYPDVTSTGAATKSFTMSSSQKSEKEIRTHINEIRGLAMRVDFPTGGSFDGLMVWGYGKDTRY